MADAVEHVPPPYSNEDPPPYVKNCVRCEIFFGNPEWGDLCSDCSGRGKVYVWDDPKFRETLEEWGKKQLAPEIYIKALWAACRFKLHETKYNAMLEIFKVLKSKNMYISAEFAYKLWSKSNGGYENNSHVICPYIIDWWNMFKYDFDNVAICYYTFTLHPKYHINSIPPPPNPGRDNKYHLAK